MIGDSLSAGIRTNEVPWPAVLARQHGIHVANLAVPGATLGTAITQADRLTPSDNLVLLEIGGNDLLGNTTLHDFDDDMRRLFGAICQPGRQVVMLELPLPPLCNLYGSVQRRHAAEFHVLLIPKRQFVAVLCGKDKTIDGLHLSQFGHDEMAAMVWRFLGPSMSATGVSLQ